MLGINQIIILYFVRVKGRRILVDVLCILILINIIVLVTYLRSTPFYGKYDISDMMTTRDFHPVQIPFVFHIHFRN